MAGKKNEGSYIRRALRKAGNFLSCLCFPCRGLNEYDEEEEEKAGGFNSMYGMASDGRPTLGLLMLLEDLDALPDVNQDAGQLVTRSNTSEALIAAPAESKLATELSGEEKIERSDEIQAIISSKSSTAASSHINPARSSVISDKDLSIVVQIPTNLCPPVAPLPGRDDLTEELKMEIEDMKSQLFTYSATFAGLHMGRELGSGAFGRVYEAVTRSEKVAIKVLKAEKMATLPESEFYLNLNEFYGEAQLLSNLNHPNILSFKFIVSDVPPAGLPGMATEFISDDLFSFIRRGGGLKSWRNVWIIAKQVADGLKYLHSKKVVHFDIKSSNILVEYSGSPAPNIVCKVADFGHAVENYSGVMRLNSRRGTMGYMAPEVIRASRSSMEVVTEKVDVYSYGILLWELIMGVLPHSGMPVEQIGPGVLKGLRPPVPNWCDIRWKSLMEACWSQDQHLRPSFDDIVDIVESFGCLLGAP